MPYADGTTATSPDLRHEALIKLIKTGSVSALLDTFNINANGLSSDDPALVKLMTMGHLMAFGAGFQLNEHKEGEEAFAPMVQSGTAQQFRDALGELIMKHAKGGANMQDAYTALETAPEKFFAECMTAAASHDNALAWHGVRSRGV